MNTKLPCPYCSSKKGYVYIQSHYQCLECKRVVDDYCSVEVLSCNSQKELQQDTQLKIFKTY